MAISIGFTVQQGSMQGLDRQVGRAIELGADGVELLVTPLGVVIGGRVNTGQLNRVRQVLQRHNPKLTIHAGLCLNFMDVEHAARHEAVAEATIDVCGALGASVLVVHPSWIEARRFAANRDALIAHERDALRRMAERAAPLGVTLALENMPVILEVLKGEEVNHGVDPASVAAQILAVDHPALRATVDVSHAHISASHYGWDIVECLAPLAPLTTHLHLHDSLGMPLCMGGLFPGEERVFGLGDLHMPLGWGNVPFEAVLSRLPLAPDLSVALEVGLDRIDDDLAAESLALARAACARIREKTAVAA